MSATQVEYVEIEHPEKKEPPPPCNGWCQRTETDEKGNIKKDILPFLNEAAGKQMIAGVDSSGKVIYVKYPTFGDPNFITSLENMPETDGNGVPIKVDGKMKIAYQFVSGVPAQAWAAIWMQRLYHKFDQAVGTMQMVVNNTAAIAQILQKNSSNNGEIQAIAPGSAAGKLPS